MFSFCSKLTSLDLSNFDTSNVTNMSSMFHNCSKLTSLDVSNFDTSKVTSMYCMFDSCSSLTSLIMSGGLNSSVNVTDMFSSITTTGTFYYSDGDYSKVIAVLPSTWTAVDLDAKPSINGIEYDLQFDGTDLSTLSSDELPASGGVIYCTTSGSLDLGTISYMKIYAPNATSLTSDGRISVDNCNIVAPKATVYPNLALDSIIRCYELAYSGLYLSFTVYADVIFGASNCGYDKQVYYITAGSTNRKEPNACEPIQVSSFESDAYYINL